MTATMEGSATLLDARLRFPVHALPGEHVVWAGTAAPRAFRASLLRMAWQAALAVLLLGGFLALPSIVTLADALECRSAVDPKAATVVYRACTVAEAAARDTDAWQRLLRAGAAGSALVALALGLQMLANALQRRNLVYVATSERVVVQDGVIRLRLDTIDLDHVVSVTAEADLIDRWFGLKSIALTVPGQKVSHWRKHALANAIALWGIETRDPALSQLLNVWLPRQRH